MMPIRHLPDTKDVQGVVIVCTDITDLKDTEAALLKSYEERSRLAASETAAKEASRLKSEFTANLSHEIRTPISEVSARHYAVYGLTYSRSFQLE